MNINHKLMTLALAFSLLGSTCAFARPTPRFENGFFSHEKKTVASHVPIARTSSATGYARHPSANTVKDDWPANMILG
jgi:hypothetical protein